MSVQFCHVERRAPCFSGRRSRASVALSSTPAHSTASPACIRRPRPCYSSAPRPTGRTSSSTASTAGPTAASGPRTSSTARTRAATTTRATSSTSSPRRASSVRATSTGSTPGTRRRSTSPRRAGASSCNPYRVGRRVGEGAVRRHPRFHVSWPRPERLESRFRDCVARVCGR